MPPLACPAQHRPEAVCTMVPLWPAAARWWRVQAVGWDAQPVLNTSAVRSATWAGLGAPFNGEAGSRHRPEATWRSAPVASSTNLLLHPVAEATAGAPSSSVAREGARHLPSLNWMAAGHGA